jgi:hypothetical protein
MGGAEFVFGVRAGAGDGRGGFHEFSPIAGGSGTQEWGRAVGMRQTAAVIIVSDEPGDRVGVEILWTRSKLSAAKATMAEKFACELYRAAQKSMRDRRTVSVGGQVPE